MTTIPGGPSIGRTAQTTVQIPVGLHVSVRKEHRPTGGDDRWRPAYWTWMVTTSGVLRSAETWNSGGGALAAGWSLVFYSSSNSHVIGYPTRSSGCCRGSTSMGPTMLFRPHRGLRPLRSVLSKRHSASVWTDRSTSLPCH